MLYSGGQRRAEYFVQPQCILRRAGYRGKDHEQVPAYGAWPRHVAVRYVRGALGGAGLRQKDRGVKHFRHLFQWPCAGPLYL